MCTVTFIPVKDKFIITSNRDEKISRKPALPPRIYYHNGSKLVFPKDADAGGTWIVVNANGNAAVLLNGAFEKHTYHPGYTKSRGLVLLDAISEARPVRYLVKTDLKTVEPFTLIVWEDNSLYEFRWDGAGKHCVQLRKSRHYIWSSATLYSKETMKKREYWLAKFLNKTPLPAVEDIMNFHASAGDGDGENDLKMTRQRLYATVSITSLTLDDVSSSILYHDCKDGTHHQQKINFLSTSFSVSQSLLHENT